MAEAMQIPQGVTYYTVTKEQLDYFGKEIAKNVLMEFGVEFDEQKAQFTPDTKNELRPLTYWLKKMNVNRSTMWRWQKQGLISPHYMGKKLFFCQADFDEMFAKQEANDM